MSVTFSVERPQSRAARKPGSSLLSESLVTALSINRVPRESAELAAVHTGHCRHHAAPRRPAKLLRRFTRRGSFAPCAVRRHLLE
jgi:hypothetical protein